MSDDRWALADGISVVVPVYNSAESLESLISRLEPILSGLVSQFEVLLINDCSSDGSWDAVMRLAAAHDWVRGISLMRNYGQHNALLCGIRAVRFGTIITIDDDLQNPPEEIPKLIAKLQQGADVVYGTPERQQHGLLRDLSSKITKIALQTAMGAETARYVSPFRAFRTSVRTSFAAYRSPFASIDVLLTYGTTRFTHVVVQHEPRRIGTSNYSFRSLFAHALNMVTGFSTVPLKVSTYVGFFFSVFGMGSLAYVLIRYIIAGSSVAGFPFLASVISIFSGAQLFALGMIGEYLARIHLRTMERPTYTVRETTHAENIQPSTDHRETREQLV
jgi:glycosyltransferase involved in cell wall biosynthesis